MVVKQVEEIGLKKEDAIDRSKWRSAVNKLSRIMKRIGSPLSTQVKQNLKHWISLSLSVSLNCIGRSSKSFSQFDETYKSRCFETVSLLCLICLLNQVFFMELSPSDFDVDN